MNITKIITDIRRDPELQGQDKMILVCLNRACDSMLEDAFFLPAEGELPQRMYQEINYGDGTMADEAVIRMSEDAVDLVTFHETRPNSRDHRPNGVRFHHEEIDFPCIIAYNSGRERMTVDGEWVSPGSYITILDVDINSPEAQKFLEKFIRSPEVMKGIEEVRRDMMDRKKRS